MTIKLGLRNVWKGLRLETLTFLFMFGFGSFLLFTLIFLIPVLIYRCFVKILVKIFKPELTHIVQSGNSIFALERITQRSKTTVIVPIFFDKPFAWEEHRRAFQSRVIEKRKESLGNGNGNGNESRNDKPGDLIYPELKQTWTDFMGYQFWKNEPNFKIEEHMRICDFADSDGYRAPEICSEDDVKELCTRLLSAPWKEDFSPWEILYIPNYIGKKCETGSEAGETNVTNMKGALITRFHHAMGDGKGWMEIALRDCLQMKDMSMPKINMPRKSTWDLLLSPLKIPYDFAKTSVESFDSENPWHRRSKRSKKYYSAVSSSTPVQFIKDLKNKFGVSYNAVLVSAISGGIRRVMIEAGQKVPKKMMAFVVLPMSGHPGGICIHATAMHTRWPIGTADPLVRLSEVFEDMKHKQTSFYPMAIFAIMKFCSVFPTPYLKLYYNKAACSLAATLFPGPMATPVFEGCTTTDILFYVGLPSGKIGAGITTIVVGAKQRVTVTIDQSLFPSNELFQKLGGFIDDELQILHQASPEAFKRQYENIV